MLIRSQHLWKNSCRGSSIEVGVSPMEILYNCIIIKRTPADPMHMKDRKLHNKINIQAGDFSRSLYDWQ